MKLLQLSVASIVDANTGHGLVHSGKSIDYAAAERHGRSIQTKTIAALASSFKSRISDAISSYRARAVQRRGLADLLRLNDRLLRDIGLTRGDLIAVKLGHTTLAELAPLRQAGKVEETLKLTIPGQVKAQGQETNAVNEANYVDKKCA